MGEFFSLVKVAFFSDVLIVLAAAGGLALVARAYFRSRAAEGGLTVEDWIMVAVVAVLGAAVAFGIYRGVA